MELWKDHCNFPFNGNLMNDFHMFDAVGVQPYSSVMTEPELDLDELLDLENEYRLLPGHQLNSVHPSELYRRMVFDDLPPTCRAVTELKTVALQSASQPMCYRPYSVQSTSSVSENTDNIIHVFTDTSSNSSDNSRLDTLSPTSDQELHSPAKSPMSSVASDTSSQGARPRRRQRQLCKFLKEMLNDNRYSPKAIEWVERDDGVFRFVQPRVVAMLWGQRRHRRKMTYEHLSRAMRYYYKHGIMKRVSTHGRLVYQFLEPSAAEKYNDD